jgi:hypothetical protein
MNQLIERYIHDVTRRLPERERDEVRRELEANIADMLPDNPGEQDIVNVLNGLGAPGKMAEQYRQTPRYLISPALYDTYISVLKTVVPIVAAVLAGAGLITAVLSPGGVVKAFAGAFGMAVSAAFQAAFWVTFGFAVAERTGAYKAAEWSVNKLPDLPAAAKGISRAETLTGMALTAFFTALFVLLASHGTLPLLFIDAEIVEVFTQEALSRSIPYIILLGCLSLAVNGFKLYRGRWNWPLCVMNAVYNAAWAAAVIWIIHWPDLLQTGFLNHILLFFGDLSISEDFVLGGWRAFVSAVLVIIAVIDTGAAVWRTVKNKL